MLIKFLFNELKLINTILIFLLTKYLVINKETFSIPPLEKFGKKIIIFFNFTNLLNLNF